eukprot:16354972-Heterocapsa_arctica.AAC.1
MRDRHRNRDFVRACDSDNKRAQEPDGHDNVYLKTTDQCLDPRDSNYRAIACRNHAKGTCVYGEAFGFIDS